MHAILVHFPVSAWTAAALLELIRPWLVRDEVAGIDLAAAAVALIWFGLSLAAVAAMAGLVELARLPETPAIVRTGQRHMTLVGSAALCFLLLGLAHPRTGALDLPVVACQLLAIAGLGLLAGGAHFGSRLVENRDQAH